MTVSFTSRKLTRKCNRQEEQFLGEVARRFGFTPAEFNSIKARHMVAAKRNPYDVLGVKPSISNEELKRHYRRFVADHHLEPGVPKEFTIIANEKRAEFNEAYEAIMKEHSI